MTFPLGSANLLLLHRELWGSRRASLTKTTSAGSQWLGGPQPSARPRHSIRRLLSQNTYRRRRLDLRTVSLSGCAFLPLPILHRDAEEFTDLTEPDNRDADTKAGIGQRGRPCQPIPTSRSVASKVRAACNGEKPICPNLQSPKR